MRMTLHNGRGSRNSSVGYSAKHNDRAFDVEQADNIDFEKMSGNCYWNCYQGWRNKKNIGEYLSFEEVERKYYEEHFSGQYAKITEGYKQKRNYDRLVSFDDWRRGKRYCPEETVFQIGNVDQAVDSEKLFDISIDLLKYISSWSHTHGNCYQILDVAMHVDEAVPHLHIRKVWRSVKVDGGNKQEVIGQNKALDHAAAVTGRRDLLSANGEGKKTYTREVRQAAIDICKQHGVDIIAEPMANIEHDRSKNKLVADKIRENKSVEQRNRQLLEKNDKLQQQITKENAAICQLRKEKDELKQEMVKQHMETVNQLQDMTDQEFEREYRRRAMLRKQRMQQADNIIDYNHKKSADYEF